MKEGTTIKVTSSQTKLIINENLGQKVRQLGPVLDALPEGSPSVLVEMAGECDFMKELKDLQGEVKSLKKKHEELKSHVKKLEEFHSDAL